MKTMPRRGVVYTIALSPLDSNIIWAGTDDGFIHVTHNGGKDWENVTPPRIISWSKISMMDASHTDKQTAYAAMNCIRLDDLRPHIYRTRDGGRSWDEIVNGLPNDPINVVKEDPQCKGLLFAGSERAVYVSFDDGEHWQSLRSNMPATSIRDLVIKDNDIAIATHGRSFWIIDDITLLREIAKGRANSRVILYKPQTACRVRWNLNTDTPLPPDEPAADNPPDGAIIDYHLKENSNDVQLEIFDASGKLVKHYSSKDTLYTIPDVNIPEYWIRPQKLLSGKAGAHRFLWDMHYQSLNEPVSYAMSAIYENTPPAPNAPWVMPGDYTVKLTVNGKTYSQPLKVIMDPRVKTNLHDLQIQHDLSYRCYQDIDKIMTATKEINTTIAKLQHLRSKTTRDDAAQIDGLIAKAKELLTGKESFATINGSLGGVFGTLQGIDAAPTTQCMEAANAAHTAFEEKMKKWEVLKKEIDNLN